MSRASFLFLGIGMFGIAVWECLRFWEGAMSGMLDLGRMMSTQRTLITAAMLLTWFCFRVSVW